MAESNPPTTVSDPLLSPNDSRFVMFPIQDSEIWKMYKKQVDCFWRAEEIDFSKDLVDWNEKLNNDERYFISMVLAFFAASDGIVTENLALRFMGDVQLAEARAFYGFQIAMENIHCVSGKTLILTDNGYIEIERAAQSPEEINIWNGSEMTPVRVEYTGNQALFNIVLSNGMNLECTSGHKWLVQRCNDVRRIETNALIEGDIIAEYALPVIRTTNIATISPMYGYVPLNTGVNDKLRWLESHLVSNGSVVNGVDIQFTYNRLDDAKEVQLLLTTLGVHSDISEGEQFRLYITGPYVTQLVKLGAKFPVTKTDLPAIPPKIFVKSISKISDDEPTYCFNEPKLHTGIFNGILTGQSETYSVMIDTYIKDNEQQTKMFNAIDNFPCIQKKATWAKRWINDNRSSFAARLIAFAVVEGIFFSASFASIYWLKKRGLMPGLTFSNQLISRDEAMHCEFAVLLYKKLHKKLQKKRVYEIIQEAVEIEKDFITEAIPCRLIGMNHTLMTQYIEFVADRLCLQLGYDKLYNTANPFDFMELISMESKVNFFERTNSEYALANKKIEDDIFEFSADF